MLTTWTWVTQSYNFDQKLNALKTKAKTASQTPDNVLGKKRLSQDKQNLLAQVAKCLVRSRRQDKGRLDTGS